MYTVKPVFMKNAYLTTQEVLPLQQMEPYGMGGFWDFLYKSGSLGSKATWLKLTDGSTVTGTFEKDPTTGDWWSPDLQTKRFRYDSSRVVSTSAGSGSSGGLFSWLGKSIGGGTVYYSQASFPKLGKTLTGYIKQESDGSYYYAKSETDYKANNKVVIGDDVDVKSGYMVLTSSRAGQGWLATIFGAIGGGTKNIVKLGGNLYSVLNPSTNQYEQKTYAQLTTTEQTQVNTSSMIPGVSNTALVVGVGAVVLLALMMSKKKQQPIIIGG